MTSAAKIAANRRNAGLSTGPKSTSGRLRAAQNSRRHGLSVSVSANPCLVAEAKAVAQKIAVGINDQDVRACGDRIAEAHVDLSRIRKIKMEMLDLVMAAASAADEPKALAVSGWIDDLARLTRYERRAASRLKRAIRDFDNKHEESVHKSTVRFGRTKPKSSAISTRG